MEPKFTYKVFDLVDGQIPNSEFKLEGKAIANHLETLKSGVYVCNLVGKC